MILMLAHRLKVAEVEILRGLEGDAAHEPNCSRWEEIIRAFEAPGDVHVIPSNGAATIEVFGPFGKFANKDGFLNVRTKSLVMHIRSWELASVVVFRKPSHPVGHEALSFQFFDKRGNAAAKVFLNFGGHDPSPDLKEKDRDLIEKFLPAD